MPDPTPPTEAERLREEFLREWFGPRQHRLGLSDIALDAILAAVVASVFAGVAGLWAGAGAVVLAWGLMPHHHKGGQDE